MSLHIPRMENTPDGLHKHKCDKCGNTWKHDGQATESLSCADHKEAHRCSRCGTMAYEVYRTPEDMEQLKKQLGAIYGPENVRNEGTSLYVRRTRAQRRGEMLGKLRG